MFNRVKEQANAKLAVLANKVDERMAKVDEKMDQLTQRASKAAAKALPSASPVTTPIRPPTARSSSASGAPSGATVSATPSPAPGELAAAARAFEKVPKEELVSLLAKTNTRCRSLEGRYAELKQLHASMLAEQRQLVASRGRSGGAIGVVTPAAAAATNGSGGGERAAVEREVRLEYESRLEELEEQVQSASTIKKSLQAEVEKLRESLESSEAARQRAEAAAQRSASEVGEASRLVDASRRAAAEAATQRGEAQKERDELIERLMRLQGKSHIPIFLPHMACAPPIVPTLFPPTHYRILLLNSTTRRAHGSASDGWRRCGRRSGRRSG